MIATDPLARLRRFARRLADRYFALSGGFGVDTLNP